MSYGQATRQLRDALGTLLTDHPHHLQRTHPPSTGQGINHTRDGGLRADGGEKQAQYAALILRYRLPVLQWALITIEAAIPAGARPSSITWVAPARLRAKVRRATRLALSATSLPSRAELAVPHPHPVVEAWRQASLAAVRCLTLEHGALAGLSRADGLLAIRDVCDLTRALVMLDDRCHSLPGWQHLSGGHTRGGGYSHSWGLLRAAERCAMWVNAYVLTTDLDGRGTRSSDFDHHGTYHLREHITPGPYPPGVTGVVDALHNGLIRLQEAPAPHLLRHLLLRNFRLATQLARLAEPVDPASTHTLERRTRIYRALLDTTTSLGGTGERDPSVVHEYDTASALLTGTATASRDEINVLHRLLTRTDQRLAHLVRDAIGNQTYLVAQGIITTRRPVGVGTRTRPRLVPATQTTARTLIQATTALANHARTTRTTVETPRPDPSQVEHDALAHRDAFASQIYARRRGTTRISDRQGVPKEPQLRELTHIRHDKLTDPASLEDVRAYLQYAVHHRTRHASPKRSKQDHPGVDPLRSQDALDPEPRTDLGRPHRNESLGL